MASTNFPGWDPIFEHEGKTYAEMEKEEKVTERSPLPEIMN